MNYKYKDDQSVDLIDADKIIEKTGHTITFTMQEVELNTASLLKVKKEIEAKKELEKAKMENIQSFHPFIFDMNEQDLLTCWLYKESKGIVDMCIKKLEQIDKQMEDDRLEIIEINRQLSGIAE